MKKIIVIAIIFLSSMQFVYSQSGWFWQNPLPQGNPINDCVIINNNTVVAVGVPSTVIKTTDGGWNWINYHQYSPDYDYYLCVSFINSQTGWIGGWRSKYPLPSSDIILKTTNGGVNWLQISSINPNMEIYRIQFLNSQVGYALTGRLNQGFLYKTTNGGINWVSCDYFFGPNKKPCFYFLNENTGWLIRTAGSGYPPFNEVARTTNGGSNWTMYNPGFQNSVLSSIFFINSQTGWLTASDSNVYKSTNGGINWFGINTGTAYKLNQVYFENNLTGWCVGDKTDSLSSRAVLRTTNGGNNWSLHIMPLGIFQTVKFYNNNAWAFSSYNHRIMKSSNAGMNWFYQCDTTSGLYCNSIYFIDKNYGWVVTSSLYLFRTTNGGNSWIKIPIQFYPTNYSAYTKVQFLNQQTGWIFNKYTLGKTMNSGINWFSICNSDSGRLNDMYFFDDNNGIILTWDNYFLRTTNGGSSWFMQNVNLQGRSLRKFKFLNYSTGWLVCYNLIGGDSSFVYKTTNTGINWNLILSVSSTIEDIYFLNNYTGWAVGATPSVLGYGVIYHTTNGSNWTQIIPNSQNYTGLSKVFFADQNTGWMIGYSKLYTTTNGGNNWSWKTMVYDWFNDIFFINGKTGWITTSGGNILKTINGGSVFVSKNSNETLKYFYLHQNYPNPFNPTTKIRFDLPKSTQTKLIIYDILGREITTLVNEKLSAGSYEVEWSAGNYPSGVYFYRFISKDFSQTKRMILIK